MTRRHFAALLAGSPRFPGRVWETRAPASLGLDANVLGRLAADLGGRGCIVKDGYLALAWGDQAEAGDWLSSAKPVITTLLFFAVAEGKVPSVESKIERYGWPLSPKDRGIRFSHLANMISGYARPEGPGKAWAYNDYAIQLYQLTLFDRVYRDDPDRTAMDRKRFGALGMQDGLHFTAGKRRLIASVRDFARIAWFWLHQGHWNGREVLSSGFFRKYQRPQVPRDLPHTASAKTDDYLHVGTFGGGSDHFTNFGAGIYGSNWWFNRTGRLHPNATTWPDGPPDTMMSIGFGGNCSVIIPSLGIVLASARGNWGQLTAGDRSTPMNRHIGLLAKSVRP